MRALFITQALGLRLHWELARALREPLALEALGFYVCDSMFFRQFARTHPELAEGRCPVLKEWEIMSAAAHADLDLAYLRKREAELGGDPLWDALVCDRRIMQGRWCRERQDYRPRFTHDRMLRILQVALRKIDRLFDAVNPEVTFGLVPVSFGEYLCYLVARARGIPTLFLYPTKIRNYMAWMESFFGRPEHIVAAYEAYEAGAPRDRFVEEAEEYLRGLEGRDIRHEGMIPIPGKTLSAGPVEGLAARAWRFARAQVGYWTTESRHDNHIPGPRQVLYRRFISPLRTRLLARRLAYRYVRGDELGTLTYAFYPLHAEPEVALSIHGKPYQNQIETVRNLARSLPVGMTLLVKEHPRCIGYHSHGYYEKLLRIPGVRLADPSIEARVMVEKAELVAAVWSFVGFEAVVRRRPAILLGTPTFGILPRSMARHVTDLNGLHREIQDLLRTYEYRERSLVHYVAANLRGGVPMNFYADYLEKRGRYREATADTRSEQFSAFVVQTVRRVHEARARRGSA